MKSIKVLLACLAIALLASPALAGPRTIVVGPGGVGVYRGGYGGYGLSYRGSYGYGGYGYSAYSAYTYPGYGYTYGGYVDPGYVAPPAAYYAPPSAYYAPAYRYAPTIVQPPLTPAEVGALLYYGR